MAAASKRPSGHTPGKPHSGGWVPKVTKSVILTCSCKVKYIKTRINQVTCIKCMVRQMGS